MSELFVDFELIVYKLAGWSSRCTRHTPRPVHAFHCVRVCVFECLYAIRYVKTIVWRLYMYWCSILKLFPHREYSLVMSSMMGALLNGYKRERQHLESMCACIVRAVFLYVFSHWCDCLSISFTVYVSVCVCACKCRQTHILTETKNCCVNTK